MLNYAKTPTLSCREASYIYGFLISASVKLYKFPATVGRPSGKTAGAVRLWIQVKPPQPSCR